MTVDDFAPVKIQHDVTALVRDPTDPEKGLLTPDGAGVVYACSVDVLAVDAADEYWVMRHQMSVAWAAQGRVRSCCRPVTGHHPCTRSDAVAGPPTRCPPPSRASVGTFRFRS